MPYDLTARFRPFRPEPRPGRSVRRPLGAFLLLATLLLRAPAVSAQAVPGFDVAVYSTVIDPVRLAFGAGGALFVGRDPVVGGSSTPFKIHRVATDGSYAEYGNSTTPDPDAPIYDASGVVSGVAGSVIVGGIFSGSTGRISAIRPDGSVVTLSQSTAITNPSEFKFDSTGRLLFAENGTRRVFTMSGATPVPLYTISGTGAPAYLAIDATDRIYTSSSDGKIRLHAANGTLINDAFATFPGYCAIELGPGGIFGGDLYALDAGSGVLYRINAVGTVTAIGSGFTDVADIAFGPDGNLYVSERALDRVLKISPSPSAVGEVVPARAPALRAFPNPFAAAVTVTYDGPAATTPGGVAIFDAAGRLVRRLGDGEPADASAGGSTARAWNWDGRDDSGRPVPAGLFFLRPAAGNSAGVLKLIRTR